MDLERIQLNEDGSLKPDLQGYVNIDVTNEPVDNRNVVQKWVDSRQDAINSSDNTFVKSFAQPMQDLQNMAVHPVQTARGMVNEAVEHPFKTMAYLNPMTFPYVASYDALKPEEGENLSNYMQRIAGHSLGAGSIAFATMGRGTPKTPMRTMSPVKGSMGGDAITGPVSYPKHLGFPARLAEELGGLPEKANRDIQAAAIRAARKNNLYADSNNAYGITNLNTKEVSLAKEAADKMSTSEHEGWHLLMQNLEDIQRATGETNPRYGVFRREVSEAIGQPVGRLGTSETLAYAIQKLQNPKFEPNWKIINSEGVTKQQFNNLIKTLQPRYNNFLYSRRVK